MIDYTYEILNGLYYHAGSVDIDLLVEQVLKAYPSEKRKEIFNYILELQKRRFIEPPKNEDILPFLQRLTETTAPVSRSKSLIIKITDEGNRHYETLQKRRNQLKPFILRSMDLTYQILKVLVENGNKLNADILINELQRITLCLKREAVNKIIELQVESVQYLERFLLSEEASFLGKYLNESPNNSMADEDFDISLTDRGIEKYYELGKLYNPSPPIVPSHTHYHTHEKNSPIVVGSLQMSDFDKKNEESEENKKLIREQLQDMTPNKWYRHWAFVISVIIFLLTIASLLKHLTKNSPFN